MKDWTQYRFKTLSWRRRWWSCWWGWRWCNRIIFQKYFSGTTTMLIQKCPPTLVSCVFRTSQKAPIMALSCMGHFRLTKSWTDTLSGSRWSVRQWTSGSVDSRAPEDETFTMDKRDVLKTIYERLLVTDTIIDETARSRMRVWNNIPGLHSRGWIHCLSHAGVRVVTSTTLNFKLMRPWTSEDVSGNKGRMYVERYRRVQNKLEWLTSSPDDICYERQITLGNTLLSA